jgi:predicted short-subunit dehydrogenase-like oxidoreductase (DUF2520 family)
VSGTRRTIAIIGAGGLARSVARALASAGVGRIVVAARRRRAAEAIARSLSSVTALARVEDAAAAGDTVLLAVSDVALEPVAEALAAMRSSWRGVIVLHAAGAYGTRPLRALAKRGASTGVLHPLAALGRSGDGRLAGAFARIEGAPKAVAEARRLARALGLKVLPGRSMATPTGRRLYHAAASLASNDLLALLVAARDLLIRSGTEKAAATRALIALADGVLTQARRRGLAEALTGPVVRADHETLQAHLAVLGSADPPAAEAHRALSARLATFAVAEGRLDKAAARRLRASLDRGRRRAHTV